MQRKQLTVIDLLVWEAHLKYELLSYASAHI